MNEKFFQLPEEKRTAIINAAIEVFGKNEYKKASTEEIAIKAHISKGLLFYYFHNKKSLYLYILDFAVSLVTELIQSTEMEEITDFFQLLDKGGELKYKVMAHPYLMEFSVRAYYSKMEDVSDSTQQFITKYTSEMMQYFKNVDFTKFREDVDPQDIINMLLWMADGYMRQYEMQEIPIDFDKLMGEYRKWSDMLKKVAYKEEFI